MNRTGKLTTRKADASASGRMQRPPAGAPPGGGPTRIPPGRAWLWFAIALLLNFVLARYLVPSGEAPLTIPYTLFKDEVSKGNVKAIVVTDTKSETVVPFVEETVAKDSTIHTDEYNVYNQLGNKGYDHQTVEHGAGQFVKGNTHTDSIEGFWAQVKNAVNGVHHGVAPEYLQQYVNEYAFRYNHRNDVTPMFQTFLSRVSSELGD